MYQALTCRPFAGASRFPLQIAMRAFSGFAKCKAAGPRGRACALPRARECPLRAHDMLGPGIRRTGNAALMKCPLMMAAPAGGALARVERQSAPPPLDNASGHHWPQGEGTVNPSEETVPSMLVSITSMDSNSGFTTTGKPLPIMGARRTSRAPRCRTEAQCFLDYRDSRGVAMIVAMFSKATSNWLLSLTS
jgi:hypothetical protein